MKTMFYFLIYIDGVVAKLIVAEEGRNDEMVSNISDVEQDDGATLEGRIVDLGELRTFDTDGEGEGKVRNVTIDDGTGTIKVVLWGDDAERAGRNYALQDVLRVINGYVQDKGYGLEISKGKYGEIEHISKEIADEREDIHC